MNMFNIDICLDAFESISFKYGMMIDMTEHYILIPVQMTLTITQGYRITRNLKLVQSFGVKWGEVAQTFTGLIL